jgi:VWFA-related protein
MPTGLTLTLLAAIGLAQEPTLKVTTNLIQVNVIVRDKNGPITGLTKEDFELFDKGKSREISVFSVVASKAAPAKSTRLPANIFSNRFDVRPDAPTSATVVLIDNLNTRFEDQAYARQQIIKFLHSLEPQDRIALYVLGRGVRVLHDFTDDPQRLMRAISRHRGEVIPDLAASEPDPNVDDWLNDMTGPMQDFFTINRVRITLTSMEAIANHLARVPGRKNLIWVSGSFPFSIGLDGPVDPGRESRTFSEEIDRATRAMNHANIAIYPVDARGLIAPNLPVSFNSRVPPKPGSQIPTGHDTMRALADYTGGRAFINTNDLRGAIRKAMEDSEVTYTLGFYPPAETLDGKYHELKVKVDRKGADVRYRKGYFAGEPEQPTEKRMKNTIADTLASPLNSSAIGLSARIDPSDKPRPGSYQVAVAVDMNDVAAKPQAGRWAGALQISFVQQAGDGKTLDTTSETLDFNMKEETYQKALRDGLVVVKGMYPLAGLHQIHILVLDRSQGVIGSLRVPAPSAKKAAP